MDSVFCERKIFADTQRKIGEAQVKSKKPAPDNSFSPFGKERIKIANDADLSAKLDSLQAVRLRKGK